MPSHQMQSGSVIGQQAFVVTYLAMKAAIHPGFVIALSGVAWPAQGSSSGKKPVPWHLGQLWSGMPSGYALLVPKRAAP